MGSTFDIKTSSNHLKSIKTSRPSKNGKRDIIQKDGNSIRIIQERRSRHTCCYNPETRKGVGAVLFTLGIPSIIAGLILTIVTVTDNDNKYPKNFTIVGPLLLVLSVVFFCSGIFLHSSYAQKAFYDCFSLDNPNSFCRIKCPAVSHFLSPDDTIVINQAAMKALQSEPSKSVLKRNRLLSDSIFYSANSEDLNPDQGDVFHDENTDKNGNHAQARRNPRGVHFSDGDEDDLKRRRAGSVNSVGDNGSLLSLKHCKIHPVNDEIWWTDEHESNKVQEKSAKEEVLETTEL